MEENRLEDRAPREPAAHVHAQIRTDVCARLAEPVARRADRRKRLPAAVRIRAAAAAGIPEHRANDFVLRRRPPPPPPPPPPRPHLDQRPGTAGAAPPRHLPAPAGAPGPSGRPRPHRLRPSAAAPASALFQRPPCAPLRSGAASTRSRGCPACRRCRRATSASSRTSRPASLLRRRPPVRDGPQRVDDSICCAWTSPTRRSRRSRRRCADMLAAATLPSSAGMAANILSMTSG